MQQIKREKVKHKRRNLLKNRLFSRKKRNTSITEARQKKSRSKKVRKGFLFFI